MPAERRESSARQRYYSGGNELKVAEGRTTAESGGIRHQRDDRRGTRDAAQAEYIGDRKIGCMGRLLSKKAVVIHITDSDVDYVRFDLHCRECSHVGVDQPCVLRPINYI